MGLNVKLLYPAQPFLPTETPRPDGSLGLLYIAGALRRAGHNVTVTDMSLGDPSDELQDTFYRREKVAEDYVRIGLPVSELSDRLDGIDMICVSSIFTMNTQQAFEIARAAKQCNPNILTIAGGGNARALYKMFLTEGFDVVVFGEGEDTICELLAAHENGAALSNVSGVALRRSDETYHLTKPRLPETDLDNLPMPAWDMLPLKKIWELNNPPGGMFEDGENVKHLPMQTSRGCPFRCSYCHISAAGPAARLRLKSIDRVMEELNIIKSLGANHVLIQDDSLLANRDRSIELFSQLPSTGLKFSDSNGVNVQHFFQGTRKQNTVDEELIDAMVQGGLRDVALAFESGSKRILNRYASKKWNPESHDGVALVKETTKRGLKTQGFFTIGYPDETYEELDETFLLAKRLVAAGMSFANFYIITPYPGTPFYELAKAGGHLPKDFDLMRLKFQLPTLINTHISQDSLKYVRGLAYKLIHSDERLGFKTNKTIQMGA